MEVENKCIVLPSYITSDPVASDLQLQCHTTSLSVSPGSRDVLVKNLFLSPDPYMRNRMLDVEDSYIPSFTPGLPIVGFGVSKVILSDHPDFNPDDIVAGMTSWETYSVIKGGAGLRKITGTDMPLSYYLGVLGMPGLTAYAGFFRVCNPKSGEEVFVSAATGAVGQLVGQFAKLAGCRVVGSAGSDEKVSLLKNKLGFDDAFNYKKEANLEEAVRRCFPRGIDIYFDNVGGKMLDAVLLNIKVFARIAVCGMISQPLHSPASEGLQNLSRIIVKRATIQGFLMSDYFHLQDEFTEKVTTYLKQGKITYMEDFVDGIENAITAFMRLFHGKNVGKQVIRLS